MRSAVLPIVLLAVSGCSEPSPLPPPSVSPPAAEPQQAARPVPEQAPPPRAIPALETYEGVVADIVSKLDAEGRAKLRGVQKEDLILYHHGWGMSIRNEYGLWSNGALRRRCGDRRGVGEFIHPDTASMLIMEGVWEAVNAPELMN